MEGSLLRLIMNPDGIELGLGCGICYLLGLLVFHSLWQDSGMGSKHLLESLPTLSAQPLPQVQMHSTCRG